MVTLSTLLSPSALLSPFGPSNCPCNTDFKDPIGEKGLKKIEKQYARWSQNKNPKRKEVEERIGDVSVRVFFEDRKWIYRLFESFIPTEAAPKTMSVITADANIRCLFRNYFPQTASGSHLHSCPNVKAESFELRFFNTPGGYFSRYFSEKQSELISAFTTKVFLVEKEGCSLP